MAYGGYFPNGYQPWYPQTQPAPAQPQQSGNSLIWVQGEAGAKSYLVAPNTTVMLMDSESDTFYIKSSDASGMPMPLRAFDYKERKPAGEVKQSGGLQSDKYVTKSEFEEFRGKIESFINSPIGKHEKEEE